MCLFTHRSQGADKPEKWGMCREDSDQANHQGVCPEGGYSPVKLLTHEI